MMEKVILFGTGRGADVAYRYLTADSPHEICGFTVDGKYLNVNEFHGLPVVEFERVEEVFPPDRYWMFVPLGFQQMNELRAKKYLEAKAKGYRCISYVSSHIPCIEKFDIGENCFILENQSINLDVKIGNNVTLWTGNHIGDCTVIKDHAWLSSHVCIAGNVTIEEYCFLGNNSTISNHVTLTRKTFVGANALIAKDTAEKGVYIVQSAMKSPMDSERFIRIINLD